MSKINLVLDLDNTLISSVSFKELEKIKNIKDRKLNFKEMENYYRVFYRPHLKEFLEYAFENFHVTVWTAASRDYASFIIEEILMENNNKGIYKSKNPKQLKMFFYDDNCEESQNFFDKDSPKDLKYLYKFNNKFHRCNTIIMDDLYDVYKANPKQTLRAVYFDAKKKESENDTFLLEAIKKLEEIKLRYESNGCTVHNHDD
jgi:hypothetical protein